MSNKITTSTNARLKDVMNRAMFGNKNMNENGNLKFLDMNLELDIVIVERFYPETDEARVIYRDTINHPTKEPVDPIVSIAQDYINEEMYIEINPDGKEEICPKTGRNSVVPDGTVIGFVLAIKGQHNNQGSILIRYLHINEDGDHVKNHGEINIKNGQSTINIKKDEIRIDTPRLYIKGVLISF